MSRAVVERLSRIVDTRASRRGFLSRSALGATALAVAPAAYALRPTTAHAAICSCAGGASCDCSQGCCDGYTDFCCFLTGENLCPPGTIVAGWWKADGSGFCDIDKPAPRYYLDCNLPCDDGCGCGGSGVCPDTCTDALCECAGRHCDNRAIECTRFRYGQCNQHVPCVGAIACRIVTCVPPWEWDPTCTTETATDNSTGPHDRPCLHEGFTDIPPTSWYTEAVDWMVGRGITTGMTDDLFGPRYPTTRAQVAAFLWRYAGEPTPPSPATFVDVDTGQWYSDPIAWMAGTGITNGATATTFERDRHVTRAEAVTFLHRMAGAPIAISPSGFLDVPAGAFFADAVAWAKATGITSGATPDRFNPHTIVTRAEFAVFLARYDTWRGASAS
ncbi:MAG: S-layer homology domain-containing protein [Actinomycetota bacterium]